MTEIIPPLDRRLDRLIEFDERSRNFPIRTLFTAATKKPRSYSWRCSAFLDQGQEGACVGFAWAHELAARPSEIKNVTNSIARGIYKTAQTLDEWPGENYEGTSVLGGIKSVQTLYPSFIGSYRWAFSLDDIILTLGYFGPVVLGINWYSGMFIPDSRGLIKVTGKIQGGHAILARAVSISRKEITLRNSWGINWGFQGECVIGFDDLQRLLNEKGEACIPVGRTTKSKVII